MTNETPSLPATPSNPYAFDLLATLQQISAFSTNPTNFPHPFNAFAAAIAASKAAAAASSHNTQEENNNISKTTSPLPSLNSSLLQQTPTSTTNFQNHYLLQSPTALCVSPQVAEEQKNGQNIVQQSVVTSSPPNLNSPSTTTTTSHPGMEGGMTTPVIGDEDKPKRRSRLGGSSVKTAEVWRFFTQLPPPEMAATCMVDPCHKTIKVTNSSTTGMIRHLRSCHPEEYKIVQEARLHILGQKAQKKWSR